MKYSFNLRLIFAPSLVSMNKIVNNFCTKLRLDLNLVFSKLLEENEQAIFPVHLTAVRMYLRFQICQKTHFHYNAASSSTKDCFRTHPVSPISSSRVSQKQSKLSCTLATINEGFMRNAYNMRNKLFSMGLSAKLTNFLFLFQEADSSDNEVGGESPISQKTEERKGAEERSRLRRRRAAVLRRMFGQWSRQSQTMSSSQLTFGQTSLVNKELL